MVRLHVNVDHVATVRQARREVFPSPVEWALAAERAGAEGITCHLRVDRRHVQDQDVRELRASIATRLNLELSLAPEIVEIAVATRAQAYCLVPENRAEVTTEGGLDVIAELARLREVIPRLRDVGGEVSLFVDADADQLAASAEAGAQFIELHTGAYANAVGDEKRHELERLFAAAAHARSLGLRINAGHGLDYENTGAVIRMPGLEEVNTGHSIVSRALTVGVHGAVTEMLEILRLQA